jgi:hypothetical protein
MDKYDVPKGASLTSSSGGKAASVCIRRVSY